MVISTSAFAQEKSSREKKGDSYFFIHSYDDAIGRYSSTKNLTVSGQRNLAESYCIMKKNDKSEKVYAAIISNGKEILPEDYYNYAMVLKSSKKYNEAVTQMNKFAQLKPKDLRAISYLENKDQFDVISKDNGNFKIREMSINSASQDFGTAYYKDQIVYASTNASPKMIKRRDNRNNEPFFNLYVADVEDGQLKNREFFDKKDNSKMHDGPASFNSDGTYMAYTKNGLKSNSTDQVIQLRIFSRTLENNEWSEPVSFSANDLNYSVGQPHLSTDGKTMYFVSDMPGGFGGTDIYRTTRIDNGAWGTPVNLGNVINTEGDEMFPFFDETIKTLHFSSDGHYGLGGLDIFSSPMNGATWGKVTNAGAPLNTNSDDYALITHGKTNTGYFSSNREGGSGKDDIYGVDLLYTTPVSKAIAGIVRDASKNPLTKATVKLFDEDGNEINEMKTDETGTYEFEAESDKKYTLTGNKKDFLEGKNSASTFCTDQLITADLNLLKEKETPKEEEDVVVADEDVITEEDLGAKIKLKPIYFAYDKSDISPTAAKELDKMVKVMNQFPTMEIELKSYTDCRGPSSYNYALSQRRAQSSADYIKSRITNPERIYGKGYGQTALVNECACDDKSPECTREQHQKNRRTEFIVKKK